MTYTHPTFYIIRISYRCFSVYGFLMTHIIAFERRFLFARIKKQINRNFDRLATEKKYLVSNRVLLNGFYTRRENCLVNVTQSNISSLAVGFTKLFHVPCVYYGRCRVIIL